MYLDILSASSGLSMPGIIECSEIHHLYELENIDSKMDFEASYDR